MREWNGNFIKKQNQQKSDTDNKTSSNVYGINFLQVWPSLDIVYGPFRKIQTDIRIEALTKYKLRENLFIRWL